MERERGAIAVISAMLLVVIMGMAALSVDIGRLTWQRQGLGSTLDAAVLSGVGVLPDDPARARYLALKYALENDPTLDTDQISISFLCMIADRDRNGVPDPGQVPAVCDPGVNGILRVACQDGRCFFPCEPNEGDRCNTLVASTDKDVQNDFAPVLGQNTSNTGVITVAACTGVCASPVPEPTDVVVIIDRTASMSAQDLFNVQDATETFLAFLDPSLQHVALGVINRSTITRRCPGAGYGRSIASHAEQGTWVAHPWPLPAARSELPSDYQLAPGVVAPHSRLVRTLRCLDRNEFLDAERFQTNFGDPVAAAHDLLMRHGREDVRKAIVFLSDGRANLPLGTQPCSYGVDRARAAERDGVEVFTIGFGIAGKRCQDDAGPYARAQTTRVLADMAGGDDDGCTEAENVDGDRFFCEPKTASLRQAFLTIGSSISGKSRLVALPGA